MIEPVPDPSLSEASRIVAEQYEIVPWMGRLYQPSELAFRPLPQEMVDVISASDDFTMPQPGAPELLNIFSEDGEAGMMILLHPETGRLYAMAPAGGGQIGRPQ